MRKIAIITSQTLTLINAYLNFRIKLPIGYCFIASITGQEKAFMLRKLLLVLQEIDCIVKVVTFDGHSTNFTMARLLGANFSVHDLKTEVTIDGLRESIVLMLDPVHMLKLCRNLFASEQFLYLIPDEEDNIDLMFSSDEDSMDLEELFENLEESSKSPDEAKVFNVEKVEFDVWSECLDEEFQQTSVIIPDDSTASQRITWQHVVLLYHLEKAVGLKYTKINMKHLKWYQSKMKVKLASQVFSMRVARTLYLLKKKLGLMEFADTDATILFIKYMNDAFDIFNSKSELDRGFKSGLNKNSANKTFAFLERFENFLKRIVLCDGTFVLNSKKRTGFLGFMVAIKSIKSLYFQLVERDVCKVILTYHLTQDFVEMFFGMVRQHCGSNNNPNTRQFVAIYKRLMSTDLLHTTEKSNCTFNGESRSLNNTSKEFKANISLGNVENHSGLKRSWDSTNNDEIEQEKKSTTFSPDSLKKTKLYNEMEIAKIIQEKCITECSSCFLQLNFNFETGCMAINDSVLHVIMICEDIFCKYYHVGKKDHLQKNDDIVEEILKLLDIENIFINLDCNHEKVLLNSIIRVFLKERKRYFFQMESENIHKDFVRTKNTKLTTFMHQ